ncbi:MAG: hypothetical protein GY929_20005 [Actinomycetia bacterium]|nr:hypothetical protein [Actinomycetes bacterium]
MADFDGCTAEHKLAAIVNRCKASVSVEFNDHTINYQTVAEQLADPFYDGQFDDTADDVKAEMAERNTMIAVRAYPDTPIGSYVIYHWSLHAALDEMLAVLGLDRD